jgi:hypothetical protein
MAISRCRIISRQVVSRFRPPPGLHLPSVSAAASKPRLGARATRMHSAAFVLSQYFVVSQYRAAQSRGGQLATRVVGW